MDSISLPDFPFNPSIGITTCYQQSKRMKLILFLVQV